MHDEHEPLVIEASGQAQIDPALPDGGLPPAVGVQSFQVFRSSRAVPELCDGYGWTYHHHVDMACWKGRLYVAWNSCERDEDVWPSRELYSTCEDGATWSSPAELFPQGISTALRIYFFCARNGRLLAIAGLRVDQNNTSEDAKGGLVVREIGPDHRLGDVCTLQRPPRGDVGPPLFDTSPDAGFIEACRQLLADRVFLEQQDRGRILGDRGMKWHDPSAWPGGVVPGDNSKWVAGKAYSFLRRGDGVLVGVSKMGWTTTSSDDGETWSMPTVPPTLVTGKAKVWGQRTSDGRYALVYNPSTRNRFPLVITTGDDGVHFRDMRIVQGELPVQRYAGMHRSIGPQYVRGISMWADDGSRADRAMWLAYSMNKEDIWVSRVPLPVRADEMEESGTAWNVYSPRWATVTIAGDEVRLEDRDPYDYAAVARVVAPVIDAYIEFEVLSEQPADEPLHLELRGRSGAVNSGDIELTSPVPGRWHAFRMHVPELSRLTFRTGPARGIGGAHPVAPETDRPCAARAFVVRRLHIRPVR